MINGKKSLFYTVLMAGALMSCGLVRRSGGNYLRGYLLDLPDYE